MKTKMTTTKIFKLPATGKLIFDMASEHYHGVPGTFSSSQLKAMLESPKLFYKKYIIQSIPREHIDAFDVGTVFHTGSIEPHKMKTDCIVYPGKVRRGKEWEIFRKKHSKKTIVTQKQYDQAIGLVKLVTDSPVAMDYVKRGKPEVSLFIKLVIYRGDIYAEEFNLRMTNDGWVKCKILPEFIKRGVQMIVKVRADVIGNEFDFIQDMKSTTGDAENEKSMKSKVSYYDYDLSASFYLDIFSAYLSKKGLPQMGKFVWTFASKDYFNCQSWEASEKNVQVGRRKWMKAILLIAHYIKDEWSFPDTLRILEPESHQLEYLNETDADLV